IRYVHVTGVQTCALPIWFARQVPSVSRAAMPDRRIVGPSAHHMRPSRSHTRAGVHSKLLLAGVTAMARNARNRIPAVMTGWVGRKLPGGGDDLFPLRCRLSGPPIRPLLASGSLWPLGV